MRLVRFTRIGTQPDSPRDTYAAVYINPDMVVRVETGSENQATIVFRDEGGRPNHVVVQGGIDEVARRLTGEAQP